MQRLNQALVLVLVLIVALAPAASAQIISTVAGGGPNGVPASSANLASPADVVVDSTGSLFIAAPGLHRVFKVDTSGVLTVAAGIGFPGFSGDGGPATQAALSSPRSIAMDAAGNLFIADANNRRVRKVDTSGVISTVAGNGGSGYNGDGGPATAATLGFSTSVAVDGTGNLFIADSYNQRVRKVDSAGNISTVAGTGMSGSYGDGGAATSATFNFPRDVAVDAVGNLFIADQNNHRIRKVTAASGTISTVAGTGIRGFFGDGSQATSAFLNTPIAVSVDATGNLFITDVNNRRVRNVNLSGIISTVAGNGAFGFSGDGGLATDARLANPQGVAVDGAGAIFIADANNNRLRRVDTSGIIQTVAGNGSFGFSGDAGPATTASLNSPTAVAVDAADGLFIADRSNHRIRKVDPLGTITTAAGNGLSGFSGDGGPALSASLRSPSGVAVDTAGNLFIADQSNQRIRKVDPAGTITTVAGNGNPGFNGDGGPALSASLRSPGGVAVDTAGNLFIADQSNQRIRKVDPSGTITTVAGNGVFGFNGDGIPAVGASLGFPTDVAVDAAGNLLIADRNNRRIRKVDAMGTITTVAGNGLCCFDGDGGPATNARLNSPYAVTVDTAGNLLIADQSNQRIRKVDAMGIITTVAGNGTFGFSGDGGPATSAHLANPFGVAVDAAGDLFIADQSNQRIRRVVFNRPPEAVCQDPTLTLGALGEAILSPAQADGGSTDPDGDPLSLTLDRTAFSCADVGMFPEVTLTVADDSGASSICSATVAVLDSTPPSVSSPGNVAAECTSPAGAPVTFSIVASDACTVPSVVCTDQASSVVVSGDTFPVGTSTATCVADDGSNIASTFFDIVVTSTAPVITSTLSASPVLAEVGSPVAFSVGFSDNAGDDHTASWDFGDGNDLLVDPASSPVEPAHAYDTPGIYTTSVTITDGCGNNVSDDVVVVVFDAADGFTTGGGWFNPEPDGFVDGIPVGATSAKASFGFMVKYKKGQSTPEGDLEFQFKAGDINLHSSQMDWMVLSNAKVRFKGLATINGEGDFTFKVTAEDNGEPGANDTFQVEIWTGVVDTENAPPTPKHRLRGTLGGGNVQIHQKN